MNIKTNEVDYPAPSAAGYLFANVDNSTNPPTITYDWRSVSSSAKPVTFSLPAGNYRAKQTLTISTTESGMSIYYTTDGTNPDTSSKLYTGPITIADSVTIKAIAANETLSPSTVTSATYTITRRLVINTQNPTQPVRYSDDNGTSWTNATLTNSGSFGNTGYNPVFGSNGQYAVYNAAYGMLRSTDRGLTWTYGMRPYYGAVLGSNGTTSWNQRNSPQCTECNGKLFLFGYYTNTLTRAPNAGKSAFIIGTSTTGQYWRWSAVVSGTDSSNNASYICSKLNSNYEATGPVVAFYNNIYIIATYGGVYRSTDDCLTWTYIKPSGWTSAFGSYGHIYNTSAGFLMSGNGTAWWSADGITWTAATMMSGTSGYAMKISDSVLICGTSSSSYAWSISRDGGKTWASVRMSPGQYSSYLKIMQVAVGAKTAAFIMVQDYYHGIVMQCTLDMPDWIISSAYKFDSNYSSYMTRLVWTGSGFFGTQSNTGGAGYPYPMYSGKDTFVDWATNKSMDSFDSYGPGVSLRVLDDKTITATDTQLVTETPVLVGTTSSTALGDYGTLVNAASATSTENWNGQGDLCYNTANSLIYYISSDFYVYSFNKATNTRTKVSTVTFPYGYICYNTTDGNLYVTKNQYVYRLTTAGVATLIYTCPNGYGVNTIAHNPANGFLYVAASTALYQISIAGSLQRSNTTKYFEGMYYDATAAKMLGADGNSTIWDISATLTYTSYITGLTYVGDRFVRLGNEYFVKAQSAALGAYTVGIVRSDLTTKDMLGIYSGMSYLCPLVIDSTLYWALSDGSLWAPSLTMVGVKTVTISCDIANPIVFYTNDGTDPTPLATPFAFDEPYAILTNTANTLQLIYPAYSTPDVYSLVNVPLGKTLKFCAMHPTYAPSAVLTYVT